MFVVLLVDHVICYLQLCINILIGNIAELLNLICVQYEYIIICIWIYNLYIVFGRKWFVNLFV